MKTAIAFAAAVILLATSAVAYACSTHTVYANGRMVTCTTCCSFGNCTTTCF